MRRRLYFMLPDVEHCKMLVNELQQNNVDDQQIHVVAREDVPLEGLHKASALEKTEVVHGVEMGLAVGGIAGLLGGLLAVTFPPAGLVLAGEAILLTTTLTGASFGGFVSALVASDIPNHELDRFQREISEGQVLLLLDIPTPDVDTMIALILSHHPEAQIGVIKSNPRAPKEKGMEHQTAS